jgi:hypothetical protein
MASMNDQGGAAHRTGCVTRFGRDARDSAGAVLKESWGKRAQTLCVTVSSPSPAAAFTFFVLASTPVAMTAMPITATASTASKDLFMAAVLRAFVKVSADDDASGRRQAQVQVLSLPARIVVVQRSL